MIYNLAEGFGMCPSFKDHFLSRRANLSITIRNFSIAVQRPYAADQGQAKPERAVDTKTKPSAIGWMRTVFLGAECDANPLRRRRTRVSE
jgi:hypothetical protein